MEDRIWNEIYYEYAKKLNVLIYWYPMQTTSKLFNKIKGTYRHLTNFNKIIKSKNNVSHHYDISEKLYDLFLYSNRQYSCAYFKNQNDTL